jgi:hypothetical protein
MPSDNDVPTVNRLDVAHRNAPGSADYYFRTVLDGQHEWYDKNAGKQKRR